jgi:putative aldouronate transport system substrate-binding protein
MYAKKTMAFSFLCLSVLVSALNVWAGAGSEAKGAQRRQVPAGPEINMKLTDKPAEPLTLPVVKDKISISYMAYPDSYIVSKMKGFADMNMYKELEKRTNVHINWQEETSTNAGAKVMLMLSTGEPADIITNLQIYAPGGASGLGKLMDDGLIVPLNWYIENYMPNLKKILLEHREVLKEITLDDGRIYMIPEITLHPLTRSSNGIAIRKDWLDKLGLQPPATLDEWYNVLTAFKTRDPNGNGKADEIPYVSRPHTWDSQSWAVFSVAFGFADTQYLFYRQDDRIEFVAFAPNYRRYLETMAKWYAEGLIDPEWASQDTASIDAKMVGDIGGAFEAALAGGMGKYLSARYRPGQSAYDLLALPTPKYTDGKNYTNHTAQASLVRGGVALGGNNKYLIETVKRLDYNFSEEGYMLINFGIEGASYVKDNGAYKYKFTDEVLKNPDGLTVEEAFVKWAGGGMTQFPHVNAPESVAQIKGKFPQQMRTFEVWPADPGFLMPKLSLSEEQSKVASPIIAEARTYLEEMIGRFVQGVDPINDANWNRFISTLRNLGVEQVRDYYNIAYRKWVSN